MIPIWDIWVRLFHWSFAATVLFMLFTGETGVGFFNWHREIGEVVLFLVVFRLLWGVIGSSNARLTSLFKSPLEAARHLQHLSKRQLEPTRGHNAAGGWAVLFMLAIVGTQAVTGLFIADEDELIEGMFYASVSSDFSDLMYSIHQFNYQLIEVLVIVHIAMILLYYFVGRQNLVQPMVTGKMKWLIEAKPPSVNFQSAWIGAILAIVVSGGYWLLRS